MKSGVYIITNKIDGKNYIGESIRLAIRLVQHRSDLRGNRHQSTHLQRAFNKYGEENFEFGLLEWCEEKFLKSQENYWCNMLDAHNDKHGYNLDSCDPNGICRKKSKETRELISKKAKERDTSGENNPFYNRTHTDKSLLIMSQTHKGKTLSEEHKKALKLSHPKGGNHWSARKVINQETNIIYDTVKEASKMEGINYVTLKDYLKGNITNKTKLKYHDEVGHN